MTKPRLLLLAVDVILVGGIALLLWTPLPNIEFPASERASSKANSPPATLRSIAAPEFNRSFFRHGTYESLDDEAGKNLSVPELRLVGVLVSDDMRMVLVELPDAPLLRLREGNDIDGWTITRIEPRSMTLTGQGQVALYALDPEIDPREPAPEFPDDAGSQDAPPDEPQDRI